MKVRNNVIQESRTFFLTELLYIPIIAKFSAQNKSMLTATRK